MERIDLYLHKNGYFDSRARAKQALSDECIEVNGKIVTKPSVKVSDDDSIKIVKTPFKYVSRGALKLLKAIDEYQISFQDKVVVDVGASTGGFTEVAIEHGAKKVYSIDVGTSQLHPKLLEELKVVNMEQTNIRYVARDDFREDIEMVVCDVSFISLKVILYPIFDLLSDNGEAVILIKPQFEAGKKFLNKHGVVRDKKVHKKVVTQIVDYAKEIGFKVKGVCDSPVLGSDGNKEFLLYLYK